MDFLVTRVFPFSDLFTKRIDLRLRHCRQSPASYSTVGIERPTPNPSDDSAWPRGWVPEGGQRRGDG